LIKAILACDNSGGVSKNGTMPWPKNSRDLKWFKSNTAQNVVVMGSTTWDDPIMPGPLPKRVNVLATTREKDYPGAHKYIQGELAKEIQAVDEENKNKVTWIIGGPNIINQTLEIIDEFYLSRIPGNYSCDTFLPLKKIEQIFEKTWTENHVNVEFQIWKKRNKIETIS
jgi:dihydrofolate reductase